MTLPRRPIVIGLAAAGLLALTFFLGRTTAPVRKEVEYRDRAGKAETKAKATEQLEAKAEAKTDDHAQFTRRKIVYRPAPQGGCEKAEEEIETGDVRSSKTEVATATATKATETTSTIEWRDREKRVLVEAAAPRWAIGAAVGVGTDLRVRYQADGAYRVLGGLSVTLAVQPPVSSLPLAVLGGVRFQF